jgi:D-beta-D-heptose 7-phosphate kinase/D-beta-D-heptose 1-phosphate adenosyltransferase
MDAVDLRGLLDRVAGAKVACVGDLMLDRYVYGEVSRISPEAPIPVLARRREKVMLGAAGNVARNVAALGARASLVGVVGDDPAGHEATELAGREASLDVLLATARGRATTVKTRFVAGAQQLLRLDSEDSGALDARSEAAMADCLAEAAEGAGALLVSDYAKGAVSGAVIASAHAAAGGRPIVVDPKGRQLRAYGRWTLIKPNAGSWRSPPTGRRARTRRWRRRSRLRWRLRGRARCW